MVQKVKIVLLGQTSVGKSSLSHRLISNELLARPETTIGVAFKVHRMVYGSREVDLNIWDTAGQERFSHFLPLYIHNAKIVFVCFELPHIDPIKKYVRMIRESDPQVIIFLIATKIDLYGIPIGKEIELIHPNVEKYAKEENLEVMYTSSKTGQGVNEAFKRSVELLDEYGLLWGWEPTIALGEEVETDSMSGSRCC